MCIEVNTGGMRKEKSGVRAELFPDPQILEWAREMDVPITLGSDAHSKDVIGADFRGHLCDVLRKVGYTHANYFVQRKRVEYRIEGL